MLRIGQLGIGFMGKMHFVTYGEIPGAKVVAICDVDPKKRAGHWESIGGNLGAKGRPTNLKGIKVYSDARRMFADPSIDVVDITLPTYLHAKYAVMALRAGKHVVCEKPLAVNSREAKAVVDAAKRSRRRLFVAQCIRFWPSYAVARGIVRSGRYGGVVSAFFRRLSCTPTWSWRNWLQDPKKSGLAALDLHIHDTDFILHCFGKPKTVSSHYGGMKRGRMDHIVSSFGYGAGKMVVAEGGWPYSPAYPFNMTFNIAMQRATLELAADGALNLYPKKGGKQVVKVPPGHGWGEELRHFVKCLKAGKPSPVVTPEDALASVRMVEAEVKSATTGKTVPVKI